MQPLPAGFATGRTPGATVAGSVEGYDHKCRRKGCGHVERAPEGGERRCPKCAMRLWPVEVPRPLRFHDLRHTTATLLLKAGVSLAVVQRILRHSDPRLTANTYGHLEDAQLRQGLAHLDFGEAKLPVREVAEEASSLRLVANGVESPSPEGPLGVHDAAHRPEQARRREEKPSNVGDLKWRARRDLNPQPSGSKPDALSN